MSNYIIDPSSFIAEGAIMDWPALAKLLGYSPYNSERRTIELRWMLNKNLGMPTGPFQVYRRDHYYETYVSTFFEPFLIDENSDFEVNGVKYRLILWGPHSMSSVRLYATGPKGSNIFAFSGNAIDSNICATATFDNNQSHIDLCAPIIDGLLLEPDVHLYQVYIHGVEIKALAKAGDWTLIELVGIPVARSDWSDIGENGTPQGMVNALRDAPTAAIQRLRRGESLFGWGPLLAPGIPAPNWVKPNFYSLVDEAKEYLNNNLRSIMKNFAPNQQASQKILIPLPPPASSGGQMNAEEGKSEFSPLTMMLFAANSDPYLNLALGFGTAYPTSSMELSRGHDIYVASTDGKKKKTVIGYDFMIVAHWERGLDGASDPVDYAAIVPWPGIALPPPSPAGLKAEIGGLIPPAKTDDNWRSSVEISWDRPPVLMKLSRATGFAFARAGISPPGGVEALMELRTSGGLRPIAVIQNLKDLEWQRIHAVDYELQIPSNPGNSLVKYGVAIQDIYGQWTPWATVDCSLSQPKLDQVRIASAKLNPVAPAYGSVCPTTLEIEFLWDWSIRSPGTISFAGRLYPAAEHGSPPPSYAVPSGLDRSLAGNYPALILSFEGDTPKDPNENAKVIGLDESGEYDVGFGPAQGKETRRYRLTLSGLLLDFDISRHIGLALWAQCRERIPPQRPGNWSDKPTIISASDPRPPVVEIIPVTLASLPDASGESHACVSWNTENNAVGYIIYESTETKILQACGRPEPSPNQTLADRRGILMDCFKNPPYPKVRSELRREFTRRNSTLIEKSNSQDITLPRGSTEIHLFLVLGVSAGGVEGNWPDGANPEKYLIAIAVPHITKPAPPMLEAHRFFDDTASAYKVNIKITTRPGPRAKRVDLHRVRVDDAAKELDTMGPPIASIKKSVDDWQVNDPDDLQLPIDNSYIQTVKGVDAPEGSWRRVWYRAAAWTEREDPLGNLPGRSPGSNAAWVVIPPSAAPAVSELSLISWSQPEDVLIEWTSPAPLKKTPLGSHAMSVTATLAGADRNKDPLISIVNVPVDKIPQKEPSIDSGVWRITSDEQVPAVYRGLIRNIIRPSVVNFIVRITDPIGRTGESLATIKADPESTMVVR